MPDLIERIASELSAEDSVTSAAEQQPVTQYCAVAIFRYKNRRVRRREVEDRWPSEALPCLPQPRRSASAWSRDAVARTARYVANMLELSGDISITEVDGLLTAIAGDVRLFTIPEGGNPTAVRRDIDGRVLTSMYEASVGISTECDYYTASQLRRALRKCLTRHAFGVQAFGYLNVEVDGHGTLQSLNHSGETAWIVPRDHYSTVNSLLNECDYMRVLDRNPRWIPLQVTSLLADEILRNIRYEKVAVSREFSRWPRTSSRPRRVAFAEQHSVAMDDVACMARSWSFLFADGGLHAARRTADEIACSCDRSRHDLRTALRIPLF